MSFLWKLRLAKQLNQEADNFEQGVQMKNSTKIIAAVFAALTTIVTTVPGLQALILSALQAHPTVSAIVGGILALGALLHNPQATTKAVVVGILVLSLFVAPHAIAQTTTAPDNPLPQNVYAGGVSYNSGASPAIAGTAMYARLVNDGSGTYAFTVVDALPVSVHPFTVNTNFGLGIAQKVVTIGKATVFVPTSAGIAFNGTNTGWAWSTGALVSVPVKNNWRVFPNVRIVKSSVSGGAGYQPIVGVLVGWGQ